MTVTPPADIPPDVRHKRLPTIENPRQKPPLSELKALTDEHRGLIELMVFGLDEPGTIEGKWFDVGQPLTLNEAARALGFRLRQARELHSTQVFQTELNKAVKARRDSERPKNLQTAIAIRDDEGAGTAADRTVRLKAIRSIEERDGPASVNVQVNNTNGVTTTPGYIIRLRPTAPQPGDDAKVIEASPARDRGA